MASTDGGLPWSSWGAGPWDGTSWGGRISSSSLSLSGSSQSSDERWTCAQCGCKGTRDSVLCNEGLKPEQFIPK